METPIHIIIEDGRSIPKYSKRLIDQWYKTLDMLYAECRSEDGQDPPRMILPFDEGRIIRFLATNEKMLFDVGFEAYGMTTLILCNHGTGERFVGHVDDVFVRKEFRGCGIGEQLLQAVKKEAGKRNLISLELTSAPKRTIAHRIYGKIGFRIVAEAIPELGNRTTNLFRLPLRPA